MILSLLFFLLIASWAFSIKYKNIAHLLYSLQRLLISLILLALYGKLFFTLLSIVFLGEFLYKLYRHRRLERS